MEILKAVNLDKKYGKGQNEFYALKDVNLSIKKGEFVCIIGKSGSGKSTLIHLLSGLDTPSSGDIIINNEKINNLSKNKMTIFRRKNIGIIYQFYNLIPILNVEENIKLPLMLDKRKVGNKHLKEIINSLELKEKTNLLPSELSGGQQQRVSIGRALITRPKILFADEPTGNLDTQNTSTVMKLLKYYNRKYKQTIIMVTHDLSLTKNCSRVIRMKDGRIVKDELKKIHFKKQK